MLHVILVTPVGEQTVCRTNDKAYAEYYRNWICSPQAAELVEQEEVAQEKRNAAAERQGLPTVPVKVLPLRVAANFARNHGSEMAYIAPYC